MAAAPVLGKGEARALVPLCEVRAGALPVEQGDTIFFQCLYEEYPLSLILQTVFFHVHGPHGHRKSEKTDETGGVMLVIEISCGEGGQ